MEISQISTDRNPTSKGSSTALQPIAVQPFSLSFTSHAFLRPGDLSLGKAWQKGATPLLPFQRLPMPSPRPGCPWSGTQARSLSQPFHSPPVDWARRGVEPESKGPPCSWDHGPWSEEWDWSKEKLFLCFAPSSRVQWGNPLPTPLATQVGDTGSGHWWRDFGLLFQSRRRLTISPTRESLT